MRMIAIAAVVSAAVLSSAAVTHAAPATAGRATVATIVRPVTAKGTPAPGFSVRSYRSAVDCSYALPSVSAVDKNIDYCAPDAEYAEACWKAATPHHVLCDRDARHRQLVKLRLSGRFPHTNPIPHPVPLDLLLRNGVSCAIRDGGAGSGLKRHPFWYATYYCTRGLAVWARVNAHTDGVDMSRPSWTVHVAPSSGRQPTLHIRHVARAWFVGTRR